MAMVTQLGLIRILSATFYGNELSICLAIGNWLWWTGFGSYSSRHWVQRIRSDFQLIILGSLYALIIILMTYILTLSRLVLNLSPSEIVGIFPIWLWVLMVFCIPGYLNGLFFPLMVRWLGRYEKGFTIKRIYIAEVVGAAVGSLSLALLLWLGISTYTIIHLAVAVLILSIALFLIRNRWQQALYLCAWGLLIGLSLSRGIPFALHQKWQPMTLVTFRESPYQAFSLLTYGGSQVLYGDSEPLWMAGERQKAEEVVHFALLNHRAPQRILIVGICDPEIIQELAKYATLTEVVNLQPDKTLYALTSRFWSPVPQQFLFRTTSADPLAYLRRTQDLFDVVILNVPLPVSANWNRYYTQEFYRLVKTRLRSDGLMALSLPGDEEYLTAEQRAFLQSVAATLAQVFRHLTWIPGSTIHLLAADTVSNNDYAYFQAELQRRGIRNLYVTDSFLRDRLAPFRRSFLEKQVEGMQAGIINRLSRPVGFYFDTVLWDQRTGGWLKNIYARLLEWRPIWLLGMISSLLLIVGVLIRKPGGLANYTIFGIGCVTMSFETVCLIIYQSLVGSLYFHIVFLMCAYMLGSALGSWCFNPERRLPALERILILYLILPLVAGWLLFFNPNVYIAAPLLYSVLFLNGILTGYSFLLLTHRIYQQESRVISEISGRCYAADIAGSAVGVYCGTVLTIPVYGLSVTLVLISLIILVNLLVTLKARYRII